jgi:tRNA-specific 2-thiouridylase
MSEGMRVAVAMSGGVDSSVAAALLHEQGLDAFGLMLRLWSPHPEQLNRCCSPEDVSNARRIAAGLGLPFYVLDVRDPFKASVVDPFIDGYTKGITPNPCLSCNRLIRWGLLLERALAMGATHLATGHYARVEKNGATFKLLRAHDRTKDQSYVLSVLSQHELAHAVFPLGELTKDEVREIARTRELPVADRPDSQDLCFVVEGDYREFIRDQGRRLPPPGPILDREGEQIGEHAGLHHYTLGQRKGLGISWSHPLYVLEKDTDRNAIIVGPREALGTDRFMVEQVNWVSGNPPVEPVHVELRVRYKAQEHPAVVHPARSGKTLVECESMIPDVTPGQAAVFYHGETCLGGGVICA